MGMNFNPAALQRVAVRMHFDPALVEQVYGGGPVEGLCDRGRTLLRRADRRAWATDPYRRSRLLHALLQAYPVSGLVAGLGRLDSFFSAEVFHACVQNRGLVALSFGTWLVPMAGPFAQLERAVVQVRHGLPAGGTGVSCAPTVVALNLPGGTVASWKGLREELGSDPVARLAEQREGRSLPLFAGEEHLLVERGSDGEAAIGWASPSLVGLLQALAAPLDREAAHAAARSHGADPGEEPEVLCDLVAQGLLILN
jgi:hypothetical protein